MSFCDDLKEQITGATYKSRCCRRALLFGIISSKAVVVDGMTVLTLANEERSDFAAALVNVTMIRRERSCPSSIIEVIIRFVSVKVFPEPAAALTKRVRPLSDIADF